MAHVVHHPPEETETSAPERGLTAVPPIPEATDGTPPESHSLRKRALAGLGIAVLAVTGWVGLKGGDESANINRSDRPATATDLGGNTPAGEAFDNEGGIAIEEVLTPYDLRPISEAPEAIFATSDDPQELAEQVLVELGDNAANYSFDVETRNKYLSNMADENTEVYASLERLLDKMGVFLQQKLAQDGVLFEYKTTVRVIDYHFDANKRILLIEGSDNTPSTFRKRLTLEPRRVLIDSADSALKEEMISWKMVGAETPAPGEVEIP